MNVIDAVAPTLPALLKEADGVQDEAAAATTLHLAGAQIDDVASRLLHAPAQHADRPEYASRCSSSPGLPGSATRSSIPASCCPARSAPSRSITALFGFSVLPVSWAGVLLLLLGVALLVVDAARHEPRRADRRGPDRLAVGAIMLFQNAPAPYHTSQAARDRRRRHARRRLGVRVGKAWQVRRKPVEVGAGADRRRRRRGAPRRARVRQRRALAGARVRRRAAAARRARPRRVARRARAHGRARTVT